MMSAMTTPSRRPEASTNLSLRTADEIAARLRVPKSWVYRAAREGTLPSVRCGRYRRFDDRDVAAGSMANGISSAPGWVEP